MRTDVFWRFQGPSSGGGVRQHLRHWPCSLPAVGIIGGPIIGSSVFAILPYPLSTTSSLACPSPPAPMNSSPACPFPLYPLPACPSPLTLLTSDIPLDPPLPPVPSLFSDPPNSSLTNPPLLSSPLCTPLLTTPPSSATLFSYTFCPYPPLSCTVLCLLTPLPCLLLLFILYFLQTPGSTTPPTSPLYTLSLHAHPLLPRLFSHQSWLQARDT